MTTEAPSDINSGGTIHKQPVRPKFLKLSNVPMPSNKHGKKNKFKFKQTSQPTQERYTDDPAYTKDVRHLALPMRRNSGPESTSKRSSIIFETRLGSTISKSNKTFDPFYNESKMKKKKDNKLDEGIKDRAILQTDTSSSDECELFGGGQSLDRNIGKNHIRTLCFQRDRMSKSPDERSRYKYANKSDSSLDNFKMQTRLMYGNSEEKPFSSNSNWSSRSESIKGSIDPADSERLEMNPNGSSQQNSKSKDSGRFRIGKQILKGEIGIKSFNYYLLKEGIKSSKKKVLKQQSTLGVVHTRPPLTRSKENIYEEIRFDDEKITKPNYPDCELCVQECSNNNCDICKNVLRLNEASASSNVTHMSTLSKKNYGLHNANPNDMSHNSHNSEQYRQNVLQYQSYNPNNPGVYKIETTPVAFTSAYNPIEQLQMHQATLDRDPIKSRISSSNDSINQRCVKPSQDMCSGPYDLSSVQLEYVRPHIYKTDSKSSILSGNTSVKSENSNKLPKPAEMSDSSIGDSLFSYPSQRYCFGSSESCRFDFECRRCSFDDEKYGFSDNCRYDSHHNCDCSSSYFSSDFDETTFSRNNSTRKMPLNKLYKDDTIDLKTTRYAEDFMKHIENVKRNTIINPMYGLTTNSNTSLKVIKSSNSNDTGLDDDAHKLKIDGQQEPKDTTQYVKYSSKGSNEQGEKSSSSKSGSSKSSPIISDVNKSSKTGTIPKGGRPRSRNISTAIKSDDSGVYVHSFGSIGETLDQPDTFDYSKNGDKCDGKSGEQNVDKDTNQGDVISNEENCYLSVKECYSGERSKDEDDDVFTTEVVYEPPKIRSRERCTALVSSTTPNVPLTPDPACAKNVQDPNNLNVKAQLQTTDTVLTPVQSPHHKSKIDEIVNVSSSQTKDQQQHQQQQQQQQQQPHQKHEEEFRKLDSNIKNTKMEGSSQAKSSDQQLPNSIPLESAAVATLTRNQQEIPAYGSTKKNRSSKSTNNIPEEVKHIKDDLKGRKNIAVYADSSKVRKNTDKTKQLDRKRDKSSEGPKKISQKKTTESNFDMKLVDSSDYTSSLEVSKYLFGENKKSENEIYLNKSGWVQVNKVNVDNSPKKYKKIHSIDATTIPSHLLKNKIANAQLESAFNTRGSSLKRFDGQKVNSTKIEELISRNEARKGNTNKKTSEKITLITDPHIAALLSERPGFLPVANYRNIDSPPLMTPIISPPPAFQDMKDKNANNSSKKQQKGMVFSKSFEYETKKSEGSSDANHSKSFDFDLSSNIKNRFSKGKFATLTGCSPNYITKSTGENRYKSMERVQTSRMFERSFIDENYRKKIENAETALMSKLKLSNSKLPALPRRPDIQRVYEKPGPFPKGFRSLDNAKSSRLNSCDSGARSDLSNDDPDDDNSIKRKLEFKHTRSQSSSLIRKQKVIKVEKTKDENYDSLDRKRSLERRRVINIGDDFLNRQHLKIIKKSSRDSSSSSDTDNEYYNRSHKSFNRNTTENRIRRSRSLQLSEKMPKRVQNSHKITLRLGDSPDSITQAITSSNYAHNRNQQSIYDELVNNKNCNISDIDYEYSDKCYFDKSRSFDDDYRACKTKHFGTEFRSFSNDRVNFPCTNQIQRQDISMSYGSRLYDHEMVYDFQRKRMNRSPIIEFKRAQSASVHHQKQQQQQQQQQHQQQQQQQQRDQLRNIKCYKYDDNEKMNTFDTRTEMGSRCRKNIDEEYSNARSLEKIPNKSKTSNLPLTAGSYSRNLCNYRPHCSATYFEPNYTDQAYQTNRFCRIDNTIIGDAIATIPINQRYKNQYEYIPSIRDTETKVKHFIKNLSFPSDVNRVSSIKSNSNVHNMCAREMPISKCKNRFVDTLSAKLSKINYNDVDVNKSNAISSKTPLIQWKKDMRMYSLDKMVPSIHDQQSLLTRTNLMRRSFSLNNVYFASMVTTDLSKQMKAVSSPSLSEGPLKAETNDVEQFYEKPNSDFNAATVTSQNVPGSVFQKLKNTLSHLKYKPLITTLPINNVNANERGKYRLGPLLWRSNKEPKNKGNRASKNSSGDSGIQDEERVKCGSHLDSDNASCYQSLPMRRANSSKETSSSLGKNLSTLTSQQDSMAIPLSKRSFSQPNGLDRVTTDERDYESDNCDSETKPEIPYLPVFAEVLYTFNATNSEELSLEKGALIEVIKRNAGPWWWGRIKHDAILSNLSAPSQCGWFPKEFVRIISQYPKACRHSYQSNENITINSDKKFMSLPLSKPKKLFKQEQFSADNKINDGTLKNAIKELLETEINYVNLLSSLCEGYLLKLKQHPNIFTDESLNIIFSNIEQIWEFQQNFLTALQTGIEQNKIAETFLEYQSAFMIYSTYCNSYPRALMELETYTGNTESSAILENCRINENLPDLPLSAHLLVPIQRICRYPLHLGELVKNSLRRKDLLHYSYRELSKFDTETIDCQEIFEFALNAMKRITETVNEGKRHSEYLSRIQARFENFQGPPLNVHSTKLFLQTDVIRVTPNLWNNTYTLFLFDHQLVYCKKDILKRTNYVYKGRIFLENCRVINLADGKLFGVTFKNTVRLYSDTKDKWFDFSFRSGSSKLRFLNTLSIERQYCGQSLFITEFEGLSDYLSDREDNVSDHDDNDLTQKLNKKCENYVLPMANNDTINISTKSSKYLKKSETLPKKSNKLYAQSKVPNNNQEYHTTSLGRRRFGNWVRRAKSTNSTPSHSPVHQSVVQSSAAIHNNRSSHNSLPQHSIQPN